MADALDNLIDATVARLEKARTRFFKWRVIRRNAKPGGKRREKASRLQDFWEARKQKLANRLKRLRKRRAHQDAQPCSTPGDPCWGGCRAVTDALIEYVGWTVTSRKRAYVPSGSSTHSEHYVGMTSSDAVDFGVGTCYSCAQKVYAWLTGNAPTSWPGDYVFFYFTKFGMRFRGQIIAANHGTGPHCHVGLTRIA